MVKEMTAMNELRVFDVLDDSEVPSDCNIIGSRWVLKEKGDTVRARLVAQGFSQALTDDQETYASTPPLTTLKLVLSLSLSRNHVLLVGDISTAFLHAAIDVPTFARAPPEIYGSGKVLKLHRALYGLKNSPLLWQEHLARTLESINFRRLKTDPNLYVHDSTMTLVVVYVDDLIMTGVAEHAEKLFNELAKLVRLKLTCHLMPGTSTTFLGRVIKHEGTHITLTPPDNYIDGILELVKMTGCKPATTPGTGGLKQSMLGETVLSPTDHSTYRQVTGKLMWIVPIRGDIAFACKELSRGLSCPTQKHWGMMKHLLRYLRGTADFGLVLKPSHVLPESYDIVMELCVQTDTDWAGDLDTRKSTTGVTMSWNGCNLMTLSRTQQTLALSSGEAELYGLNTGVHEALSVRNLIIEANLANRCEITVFTGSTTAKAIATRTGLSKRTRHVHIKHLWLQELTQTKTVTIKRIAGPDNTADILTKYVDSATLQKHCARIGIYSQSTDSTIAATFVGNKQNTGVCMSTVPKITVHGGRRSTAEHCAGGELDLFASKAKGTGFVCNYLIASCFQSTAEPTHLNSLFSELGEISVLGMASSTAGSTGTPVCHTEDCPWTELTGLGDSGELQAPTPGADSPNSQHSWRRLFPLRRQLRRT
jgi:hypothetical protein